MPSRKSAASFCFGTTRQSTGKRPAKQQKEKIHGKAPAKHRQTTGKAFSTQ